MFPEIAQHMLTIRSQIKKEKKTNNNICNNLKRANGHDPLGLKTKVIEFVVDDDDLIVW